MVLEIRHLRTLHITFQDKTSIIVKGHKKVTTFSKYKSTFNHSYAGGVAQHLDRSILFLMKESYVKLQYKCYVYIYQCKLSEASVAITIKMQSFTLIQTNKYATKQKLSKSTYLQII